MPAFSRAEFASLLAGCLLLPFTAAILAPRANAINAEESPIAAPPAGADVFQNPMAGEQLQFLNDYAHREPKEVMKDKRYKTLMKSVVPQTVYHYGRDMALSDAIKTLLGGPPLPVEVRDGRYVMVASHGGPYLRGRGFMWFDMQQGVALGGIFFQPVNGEPSPTLTIFSRQLKDNSRYQPVARCIH